MTASGTRHGNLFWEEEKANVGLRMMQGMGWQQGSGLGARGHGMTSHIRVRQKKDNSGIGANAETRDDSWKATQDVFNSILTRLNSGSDGVAGSLRAAPARPRHPPVTRAPGAAMRARPCRSCRRRGRRRRKNADGEADHGAARALSQVSPVEERVCVLVYGARPRPTRAARERALRSAARPTCTG